MSDLTIAAPARSFPVELTEGEVELLRLLIDFHDDDVGNEFYPQEHMETLKKKIEALP